MITKGIKYWIVSAALLSAVSVIASAGAAPENPFSNDGSSETGVSDVPRPDAKPEILLRMSRKDCERLLRRADQPGVAYVPGVDVRGNRVVGAELAGTLTASDILPKEIAFELVINPVSFAGNEDLAAAFSESSTSLGTVRYNLMSGSLTLDGRKLGGETEQDMIALCHQALGR